MRLTVNRDDELIRKARKEACEYLAALGGTMPNFEVPSRNRVDRKITKQQGRRLSAVGRKDA